VVFPKKPKKIGLALGGGAVRGFAHLGVLKVLEEAGVVPSYITGTSVGSLVGALYSAGLSADKITDIAREIGWKDLVKPTLPKLGLLKTDGIAELVDRLAQGSLIEELKIPFKAVAVDLSRGKVIAFDKGPLGKAVQASCSIPGIFEPVKEGESLLLDGGIINNLPADLVREMGAEYVIAVDLNADLAEEASSPKGIFEILITSFMRMMSATGTLGREEADCLITPDLAGYNYHDMDQMEDLFIEGKKAAEKALPELRKAGIIK